MCKEVTSFCNESPIVKCSLSLTGLVNTAFTQYIVEEPTAITSVINTAAVTATESVNREQASQLETPGQTSAKCDIKETEL